MYTFSRFCQIALQSMLSISTLNISEWEFLFLHIQVNVWWGWNFRFLPICFFFSPSSCKCETLGHWSTMFSDDNDEDRTYQAYRVYGIFKKVGCFSFLLRVFYCLFNLFLKCSPGNTFCLYLCLISLLIYGSTRFWTGFFLFLLPNFMICG